MRSIWKLRLIAQSVEKGLLISKIFKVNEVVTRIGGSHNERLRRRLANGSGFLFFNMPRSSAIGFSVYGLNFLIYTGKNFYFFKYRFRRLPGKLGEYCFTKTMGRRIHEKQVKKKAEKR